MTIQVTSTAFREGEPIPSKYTCKGSDISPPLAWTKVPSTAKTMALIADDPDAPMGTWVHWVLYNLPANMNELPEAVPNEKHLSSGASQGVNSSGKIGYQGPCPPSGTHRYYFKVYALDTQLKLSDSVTKSQLLEAMKGHVLAEGTLMGRFSH
ncbi:YbhB/YbcL family Raf kinase inhibitor-like protein [bacterium]|nr:YbhB/YbcL family Raf kinase inhibitor-like protein [bacterium]